MSCPENMPGDKTAADGGRDIIAEPSVRLVPPAPDPRGLIADRLSLIVSFLIIAMVVLAALSNPHAAATPLPPSREEAVAVSLSKAETREEPSPPPVIVPPSPPAPEVEAKAKAPEPVPEAPEPMAAKPSSAIKAEVPGPAPVAAEPEPVSRSLPPVPVAREAMDVFPPAVVPLVPEAAREADPAPRLARVMAVRGISDEPSVAVPLAAGGKSGVPNHIELTQEHSAQTIEAVATGRTLLRLLEHGSGPSVEIAWPDRADDRERLYRLMVNKLGMRSGLFDPASGILHDAGGSAPVDFDRYSAFVRYPEGVGIGAETTALADVRRRQGGGFGLSPVRLFPRKADALLLGGLRELVGDGYDHVRSLRARYKIEGGTVMVSDIEADGRALSGNIGLIRASP